MTSANGTSQGQSRYNTFCELDVLFPHDVTQWRKPPPQGLGTISKEDAEDIEDLGKTVSQGHVRDFQDAQQLQCLH